MPTIDELDAATVSADTDEFAASQNGTTRKVTRAQIVAGLQPQLALTQGTLLGCASTGEVTLEPIALGANLQLSGAVLSGTTAPFAISNLPTAATPRGEDLISLAQNGANVALPYAQFMAGLSGVAGVNASALAVTAAGATATRTLAAVVADAVSVEDYGAVGDGVTDDTTALAAAVASGKPVRLGPNVYAVSGQWTIGVPTRLLGVPGQSTLRRIGQSGNGAFISVQGASFSAQGVTFDANKQQVNVDSWGVLVTAQCTASEFNGCVFCNAAGANLGTGLVIQASDPAVCQHVVRGCEFAANTVHGLWVQACAGVLVAENRAHDNGQYGLDIDFNDPTFTKKVHLVQILGNRAWNNVRGIDVGNFNATNTEPPTWGNANPDAISLLVTANLCHDNTLYGISAAGQSLVIAGNLLVDNGTAVNGAGILANIIDSRVIDNTIVGSATFGIDCGGSIGSDVSDNAISGAANGINCGGSQNMRVTDNVVQACSATGICVNNVETDGAGNNFGIACSGLAITDNWIELSTTAATGVLLRDGPQNVLVARNCFVGTTGSASAAQCLVADTDSLIVEGNHYNFSARFTCNPVTLNSLQTLVFPDIAENVMVTVAPSGVQSMLSSYQAALQGQISFVRVTAAGSGYTTARVAIGGAGSGATAQAVLANGTVLAVVLTARGSGYGPVGTTVPVTITGDGAGAQAVAYAAPPVPEERHLVVHCNCPVLFSRSGSNPVQENWTGADLTIAANGTAQWVGTWGTWRAASATH
jgi:hypothetical protein